MINKKVSIILVTFNCESTIKDLLKSILYIDWKDLEIIIVDNGSKDATTQLIEETMPIFKKKLIIKFLKLNKNMGFCYAANIAVHNSSGEFLCFIDHIEMTSTFLRELIQCLELDNNLGAVQPKVINAYDKRFIDSYDFNENGSMRGKIASSYRKSRKILYCIGACCLTRRKTYECIGRFYDDFFTSPDVDFGWRLWLFGYSVKSVPNAEIYHKRGTLRNTEQLNLIFEYNSFKNKIAMIIQNLEMKNSVKYLVRMLRIPFLSLFSNPSYAYLGFKGILWNIRHMRRIIQRRYFIQHSRKIRDEEILGMLKHILPHSIVEEIKVKI
jgi:GT2 family glycosyltransferase